MIALNNPNRLCAVPCQAKDIESAQSAPAESGLQLFQTPLGLVSRVCITGLLVSWDGNAGILDDGTGRVLLRIANEEPHLAEAPLGSVVLCIGRIRNLGEEKYLSVEAAHALQDTYWLTYRKYETALFRTNVPPASDTITGGVAHRASPSGSGAAHSIANARGEKREGEQSRDPRDIILDAVRLLDSGDGADASLVLKRVGAKDERVIERLIKEGDLYEVKPGRLKTLE